MSSGKNIKWGSWQPVDPDEYNGYSYYREGTDRKGNIHEDWDDGSRVPRNMKEADDAQLTQQFQQTRLDDNDPNYNFDNTYTEEGVYTHGAGPAETAGGHSRKQRDKGKDPDRHEKKYSSKDASRSKQTASSKGGHSNKHSAHSSKTHSDKKGKSVVVKSRNDHMEGEEESPFYGLGEEEQWQSRDQVTGRGSDEPEEQLPGQSEGKGPAYDYSASQHAQYGKRPKQPKQGGSSYDDQEQDFEQQFEESVQPGWQDEYSRGEERLPASRRKGKATYSEPPPQGARFDEDPPEDDEIAPEDHDQYHYTRQGESSTGAYSDEYRDAFSASYTEAYAAPEEADDYGDGGATPKGPRGEMIRGDETVGYEPLDPRYVIEHSSKFRPGEVFKVLWSEPKGRSKHPSRPTIGALTEQHVKDAFGERFFVGFRRFIVVATDEGHSTCVPILTYERKGCLKSGVKPRVHGIVHSVDKSAKKLDGEPKLGFPPVRMKISVGDEKLARESRINYSKLVTVEHNVKVFFIGRIVPHDLEKVHEAVDECWFSKRK